ncbi:MAG: ParA family protein [PVC group bacterium]|nr:ParA family protein [PVC group bacterium]
MIIAVTNQKGGVGKTTITINLSAALAILGYRVLTIDMDPQGNSSDGMGIETNTLDDTIYDTLVNDVPLSDIILPHQLDNWAIAPANISLSGAETELASDITRPFKLRKALRSEAEKYDFVLIDSPPSLGILTVNAIVASNALLVPIEPNSYALKGMSMLMSTILKIKEDLEHYTSFLGVAVNMFDPSITLHSSVTKTITEYFTSRKVFDTIIHRSRKIPEAEMHGQHIHAYAPQDEAARHFMDLAKEVVEKNNER